MDELMALADANDLYVIEDCAQAHCAKYKGRSVGSIGNIDCWFSAKIRSLLLVVKAAWLPVMMNHSVLTGI
jgi:hypothetical protein